METLVTKEAPGFKAQAVFGNNEIKELDLSSYRGKYGEVCPANWRKGDEAMKPTAQGVADYLAKHA